MIIATVWTGNKYPLPYVTKLYSMVERYLPKLDRRHVCLTDRPQDLPDTIEAVDISDLGLPGWWGKMALFRKHWREGELVLYFDLDTVVCGEITPLTNIDDDFAICQSFVIRAGHPNWPCAYGSAVMVLGKNLGQDVWDRFFPDKQKIMPACPRGDQEAIEKLRPGAPYLQDMVPEGFFIDRREVIKHPKKKPATTSVVCFAGPLRPHNCNIPWVQEEWTL